jgi:hypothetical protein
MRHLPRRVLIIALSTGLTLFVSFYLTNSLLLDYKFSALGQVDNKPANKNSSYYLVYASSNSNNSNETARDNINSLLITLASDRTAYSVGDKISLSGNFLNNTEPVANVPIIIEASSDNKTFYKNSTLSDTEGKFNLTISSLQEGSTEVSAKVIDRLGKVNAEATLTVLVNTIPWGIVIPIVSIISSFALLFYSFPKYHGIGMVGAIALTATGYFFLYSFSPFDTVGNGVIAAALLAPFATYVFDTLRGRREAGAATESSVVEYRKNVLNEEVKSLSNLFEEISVHQAIFKAEYDIPEKQLSTSEYEESRKTGTLANLPGLRVNRYYIYVDYYNKFLEAKVYRRGELADDDHYDNFCLLFQQMKDAYSRLNTALYVTLLYNLVEIQSRYLSYPTIEFPLRSTTPLVLKLVDAGVLKDENQIPTPKIYTDVNYRKLRNILSDDFEREYGNLEDSIRMLMEFSL